ncbi:NUDIX domain-containing protein [Microbacterium sp. SSW1-49]|uniref:NUDIX domain-containing protein n=1 Tax=Microbacterium croceum TaxID=2851645 RepID=A0ABT0FFF9_9MICO|nr:NUDIX domain-containing protein [Microbacterium croceum]MCK2036389.1 NUDIX domain-containing protein [Microbacterium croceum]
MSDPEESLPVAGTVVLLRPAAAGFEVLLIRRPDRGSFAGAWVFPGGKVEEIDRRPGGSEREDARRAGIRETLEEVGLEIGELVVLSQWQPPREAPTRIRTWFFLAAAPDQQPSPSADEVSEIAWVSPASALERHGAGAWTLFPPTWMTLHRLTAFDDIASVLAAAGTADVFQTRVHDEGRAFEWAQGRLDASRLPWTFGPA